MKKNVFFLLLFFISASTTIFAGKNKTDELKPSDCKGEEFFSFKTVLSELSTSKIKKVDDFKLKVNSRVAFGCTGVPARDSLVPRLRPRHYP